MLKGPKIHHLSAVIYDGFAGFSLSCGILVHLCPCVPGALIPGEGVL